VWETNLQPLQAALEHAVPAPASATTLLVTENFPPRTGGSSRWFHELYRRLSPARFVVVAADAAEDPGDRSGHMRVHRVPLSLATWSIKSLRGVLGYGRAIRRLLVLARDSGAGMIHCGRPVPEGVMALVIRAVTGRPYLCYVHGEELAIAASSRELTWLARHVLSRARGVIANSGNTARILGERWSVPPEKLRLMHPGVDTQRYVPARPDPEVRMRLGWAGRRVVLTAGRLQRRKGQDNLIRALPEIRGLVPEALYAIVGDGEERGALEALAREVGVQDAVLFMGEVDDATLLLCYQQCELFALPNREVDGDFEGFGIVLIEAQACGKAVVAGASGGTAETMCPGVTGVLVDARSPGEIAAAVGDLLADPDRLARMGDAGRAWVVENFDWTVLARRAEDVFTELGDAIQPARSSS
jgi:phosphatidylinositol alpha-1,6-mannosyltransferase